MGAFIVTHLGAGVVQTVCQTFSHSLMHIYYFPDNLELQACGYLKRFCPYFF